MTKKEADQIARILGQYHDAFAFLSEAFLRGNQNQTVASILSKLNLQRDAALCVFGFAAVAFIFSHDCVAKSLRCADELLPLRHLRTLGTTQNDVDASRGESNQAACLRHMRNCFAHGRFTLELKRKIVWVDMMDQNPSGRQTFAARCKAESVIRVAERTLIKTYKIVAVKAAKAR